MIMNIVDIHERSFFSHRNLYIRNTTSILKHLTSFIIYYPILSQILLLKNSSEQNLSSSITKLMSEKHNLFLGFPFFYFRKSISTFKTTSSSCSNF